MSRLSLLVVAILAISMVPQVYTIREVIPDWIPALPPSKTCSDNAYVRPCRYTDGRNITNYPPNYPCPCSQGDVGGALPAKGPVGVPATDLADFEDFLWISGEIAGQPTFTNLVGMAFTDNTQELFVYTKAGVIFRIDLKTMTRTVWIDLSDEVNNVADKGLIAVAAHPNFAANPHLFLSFSVDQKYGGEDDPAESPTWQRIIRITSVNNVGDDKTRVYLLGKDATLAIQICSSSHVGGGMQFGWDGSLFITSGDGGHFDWDEGDYGQNKGANDALCDTMFGDALDFGSLRAQYLDSLNGKLLRIDPTNGKGICPGTAGYSEYNPYCDGDGSSVRSRVYAMGFRNPFSLTIRPKMAGDVAGSAGIPYVGDVGFGSFEEVNAVTKSGMDFGWPCWEGGLPMPLHRDSFLDPMSPANSGIKRPKDHVSGATMNCNWVYNNRQTDMPFYFYTRYPERSGLAGKDLEYMGQGILGNCIGGVTFYTGDSYPEAYKNNLFVLDYGKRWIHMLKRDSTDKYVSLTEMYNMPNSILTLTTDPSTGNVVYTRNLAGEVRMLRYTAGNIPPTVFVQATPQTGAVPLSVQFTMDNTADRENDKFTTIQWDFGDGTPAVTGTANPVHVYQTAGIYNAKVTVTDANGAVVTSTVAVNSNGNKAPVVTIISPVANDGYYLYNAGEVVTFSASADDEDKATLKYHWEVQIVHNNHIHTDSYQSDNATFSVDVAALGASSHANERFNLRVYCTVTDKQGASTKVKVFLSDAGYRTVFGNAAPVADFSMSGPTPMTAGQVIKMDGSQLSTDADMDFMFYSWDYGDNLKTTSEGAITHIYDKGGVYKISLTVTDNWGWTSTVSKYILVLNADGSTPTDQLPAQTQTPQVSAEPTEVEGETGATTAPGTTSPSTTTAGTTSASTTSSATTSSATTSAATTSSATTSDNTNPQTNPSTTGQPTNTGKDFEVSSASTFGVSVVALIISAFFLLN